MEIVKKQFLDKKIEFSEGQEEVKPDISEYRPHKAIPTTERETKTNKSLDNVLLVNNIFFIQKSESINQEKRPGPADKLSEASGWMDPIVEEIVSIEDPLPKSVEDVFERHYPDFKKAYRDQKNSKMANGERINLEAVCRALAYLYKIKNGNKSVSVRAIQKKYREMGLR